MTETVKLSIVISREFLKYAKATLDTLKILIPELCKQIELEDI